MKKICLFSGTSEGRELAFSLARYEAELIVCTATGYGGSLSASPRARVCAGEMDCSEMERFFEREKFDCVIDATHPHARAVTQNIRDAASAANVKCFRVLRGLPAPDSDAVCVRSASEAAAYLSARNGRIFLTTGSRSLARRVRRIGGSDRRARVAAVGIFAGMRGDRADARADHCHAGAFQRKRERFFDGALSVRMARDQTGGTAGRYGCEDRVRQAPRYGRRSDLIARNGRGISVPRPSKSGAGI